MIKREETHITEERIEELVQKIVESIKQKEESGKKDRSVKVETKTGIFARITRNPEEGRFYLSISPRGGHPIYNKVIFDSSEKLREFFNDLKEFLREREDILVALDKLNQKMEKKSSEAV